MKRIIFAAILLLTACGHKFERNEQVFGNSIIGDIPVYKIAFPVDSVALDAMNLDVVEKKKIRNGLNGLEPIAVQVGSIQEDIFYRAGSALMGNVISDTSAEMRENHGSEVFYEIDFGDNIIVDHTRDYGKEKILNDKRYQLLNTFFISGNDLVTKSDPKYH